jgi:glycosyltransferase involved in cell wall biosynthesis
MSATSTAPLVSILLASRNGERFLPEALQSLASQTYTALEPILVDDGSADRTGTILEEFAASHPPARVLHTRGVGLASALALAAGEARGEYLARQDDDDRSHPERIERQVRYLASHPEVAVLGTAAHMIDGEGRRIGTHPVPLSPEGIRRTLGRAAPFVHGSVVMRRDAYEAAGGYRGAFRASQDYDLWLRIAPSAGLANLAEPLYEWRLHDAGVFSRARADQLFYAAVARAFAEERRDAGSDSESLLSNGMNADLLLSRYPRAGRLALYLGQLHAREGLGREARRFLSRALRDPQSRFEALPWWLLACVVPWTPRGRRAARRAGGRA